MNLFRKLFGSKPDLYEELGGDMPAYPDMQRLKKEQAQRESLKTFFDATKGDECKWRFKDFHAENEGGKELFRPMDPNGAQRIITKPVPVAKGIVEYEFDMGKNDVLVAIMPEGMQEVDARSYQARIEDVLRKRGRVSLVLEAGSIVQLIHREQVNPRKLDTVSEEFAKELDAIHKGGEETLPPFNPLPVAATDSGLAAYGPLNKARVENWVAQKEVE